MRNPTEQQIDDAIANFTEATMSDHTGQFNDRVIIGQLKSGVCLETGRCTSSNGALTEFKDLVAAELEMYP